MPHPDVIVAADPEALARAAAERILARLRRSSGRSAVSLTGGSTPEHLYELLASNQTLPRCPFLESYSLVLGR